MESITNVNQRHSNFVEQRKEIRLNSYSGKYSKSDGHSLKIVSKKKKWILNRQINELIKFFNTFVYRSYID